MRKCVYACVAFALATVITGCGSGKGQSAGLSSGGSSGSSKTYAELHWGMPVFAGPIYQADNSYYVGDMEQLAVQNLVEFEPDGNTRLGLASSVEQPNPTTYIYHLKQGVRFSDGKPLTAADVVFSLNHNIDGKESIFALYWGGASVSERGSSTVMVKLARPNVAWPKIMAATSQVIEKAAAEKVGEKAVGTPNGLPIGTGPWKFDGFKPEVEVTFSQNPYWKGAPRPASRIKMSLFKEESTMALALRSGAIDGAFWYVDDKLFQNIPNVRQLTSPVAANMTFFGMNVDTSPFNNVHVRRAIAYAANVKGMIEAVQESGLATEDRTLSPSDLFSSGLGSSTQVNKMLNSLPSYSLDLAAAKRELDKSPYVHGFSTTVQAIAAEASSVIVAQVLASDLGKIGIKAKVEELTPAASAGMFGKKVKIYVQEYSAPYPDPSILPSFLLASSQIKPPGSGLNFANYSAPEVDRLQDAQGAAANPDTRRQLLGKMLGIAGAEEPYRPLYTHLTWASISNRYVYPTFSQWTFNFTPWALDVKLAG